MSRDTDRPGARRDAVKSGRARAAVARSLAGSPHARRSRGATGRAWRWAHWARVVAGRFRMAARVAERLVLTFGRGAALGRPGLVERIVERVRFGAAPALRLTVQPRLALAGSWRDAGQPASMDPGAPGLGAAGRGTPSFAHAAGSAAASRLAASAPARVLARIESGAIATPIERLPSRAGAVRITGAPGSGAEAARGTGARGRRRRRLRAPRGAEESVSNLPGRPAQRTLHRPPRHSPDAAIEAVPPRRHGPAASTSTGGPASGPSVPGRGRARPPDRPGGAAHRPADGRVARAHGTGTVGDEADGTREGADQGPAHRRGLRGADQPRGVLAREDNNFASHDVPGLSSPLLQFVHGNLRTLTMELFFDTTDAARDVRERRRRWCACAAIDSELHAPPAVSISWGSLLFTGVLASVRQTFNLFLADGRPVRARLDVTWSELIDPDRESREVKRQTADFSKRPCRLGGRDALRRSPPAATTSRGTWRPIALENGIDDPRRDLFPGRELVVPSLPYLDPDTGEALRMSGRPRYVPDYEVRINDDPLPAAVRSTVSSVRYEDGRNAADRVEVELANPDLRWLQRHIRGLGFRPPSGFDIGPVRVARGGARRHVRPRQPARPWRSATGPVRSSRCSRARSPASRPAFPAAACRPCRVVAHDKLNRLSRGTGAVALRLPARLPRGDAHRGEEPAHPGDRPRGHRRLDRARGDQLHLLRLRALAGRPARGQ